MKRIITAICCVFAAVFIAAATVDFAAKDKLYPLIFDNVNYEYTVEQPQSVTLKNGDYVLYGTYRGEQVLWKVISQNGTLLQSEYIIDFAPYGVSSNDCDLLGKINSSFNGIAESVHIPSKGDLSELSAKERQKQPTLSAVLGCKTRFLFVRKNCWYWTSSSISTNSLSVATVTQSGSFYKSPATDSLTGVCPTVKLDGNTAEIVYGNGTKKQPYVIGGERK